jgi:uroporphyrinogen decarboxylase
MTSRERVLTTIAHREPDRVPFNLRPDGAHWARLREVAGEVDFADYFGHDVRYVGLSLAERPDGMPDQDWAPCPEPQAVAAAAEVVRGLQERGLAVCSSYACGVYEQAKAWLGDVPTMVGPYEDPGGFAQVVDRITEWKGAIYGAYAQAGVDIVWIGDDLGTQRSLVMSPAQYREWYRPCHQRIVDRLRAIRPGVRIAFHCCGHVTPLIGDLIELGIDVLEAVQSEAMDLAELKREYGRDITFWGGIGAQSILTGTAAEVWEGVGETLALMAPGGGYIAAPCHTLTPEVPWENVVALQDAIRTLGAYPDPGRR